MSSQKRVHEAEGETPSKKRIESEVATPEQQTVALSHVQVIDVLQWLPEEKAKQVDTWINIESEWNLEKVPGVETVKAIIRGIIFNWEIVSQYQSTLDSSPNAWKDFSWDHTESTTMTWPSAPIRSYLKSSLVKLVCGIVKEGLETSCSSASMMNMSTSSTRVPTPTDHAVPYVLRRQAATRRHCRLFEYTDWYNVLLYTCSGGRNGVYYQVDCSNWRLCTGHGSVPAEGHSGEEPRHLVENEGLSSADPIFQRESDPIPRGANQTAHQCEPSSSKSEGDKIKAKIKSIMLQLLPVPLIDVVYCEEYLARPDVMYKRQRHVAVQDAADVVLAEINLMSIKDIYSLNINTPFRPRYHAIKVDRDDYYMSIEESLSAYKNLLLFQLGDYENVYHFCKQLFNVLNMSKPKRNTFIIVGEQCSGKNFFIDPITATIINVGYLGNPNKNNNFAYQDCVNRRVIVWNEPNYASEEVDTLKMILGGDVCPVRVKFRGDCVVHRTPVIILTNENLPLMNDPTFVNRIYVHTWRYCPQLVEYSKKCHPLTFFELCIKMGIMHV
ncbi:unnamed protein product [Orchesella dallaii]|uniref:SF3 helicase domain-containing protein n=1 Tax=Orchesella dallaii TaxID=48710 RepID=A0ABP1RV89_9HEXA